jgi:hypothetical protein
MTQAEQAYCYSQSQQISGQTGLIGHLRADFGSNGTGFFSNFFDFRKDLKSEDFKAEINEVINALREDQRFGGILASRTAMSKYCKKHPGSSIEPDYNYGFRADTDHYSYMLRVTPKKGEYNLYCYCYLRQWLDGHMKRAEKGIRFFIDYKERFRLADGDRIRLVMESGENREMTCRYIDDHHMEVFGQSTSTVYHIDEFVEAWKNHGCTEMIPLRKSLPEKCFSFLESSGELIVIEKGKQGYSPTGIYPQSSDVRAGVDAANEVNGVTKAQSAAMKAGSMFGWDKPAADPANYDDQGIPIRPGRKQDRGDAR